MEMTDFQKAMSYLASAFDTELTQARLAVYWDQFGSLDGEQFMVACKVAVREEKRFPVVRCLREYYDMLRSKRPKVVALPRLESTEAVLREHARMKGVPEDEYLAQHGMKP